MSSRDLALNTRPGHVWGTSCFQAKVLTIDSNDYPVRDTLMEAIMPKQS